MTEIPRTKYAPVVRTDFSDGSAWDAICAAIREPNAVFGFMAYVDFVGDPEYEGLTPEQLLSLIPDRFGHTFFFIVDGVALRETDHPILVVDLCDEPGRTFRVIPSAMWGVENNLSTANMSFAMFADEVDRDGVYRNCSES